MIPATLSAERIRLLLYPLLLLLALPPRLPAQQPPKGTPFTFIAIGDAGQPGPILISNGKAMDTTVARLDRQGRPPGLLLFLGDNFYPNGLNVPKGARADRIEKVLKLPFDPIMNRLGPANVHAVSGNHEYYGYATIAPLSLQIGQDDTTGNRAEREEIDRWTFYFKTPASIRRPISEGGDDLVEFIFFDSSYLLSRIDRTKWLLPLTQLDSILRQSAQEPRVKWRVLVEHHSPYSVGEHGGYRIWSSRTKRTRYWGHCDNRPGDPFSRIKILGSPQDNCSEPYRAMSDSLLHVIARSGARVQMVLAGHDHSLQLLAYPDSNRWCSTCPKIFAISGAGSKRSTVKYPTADTSLAGAKEFTHPVSAESGLSAPGFMTGTFERGNLVLTFVDGRNGLPLVMNGRRKGAGAKTSFVFDPSGALVETR